ncbi:MAG: hydroxyphenylacetyl-CoA thioesterase PaaI [Candidatus Velthaea sp.]
MPEVAAADELARACAAAMFARDRAAQQLGVAIDEIRAGYAQLSLTIGESMINGHAIAHGGIVFMLADTAFAYACNSRNVPHVALGATISFAAPARAGDRLCAEAEERSLAGRTGIYDITVTKADSGDLIGVFRGTCYRIHGTVIEG